MAYTDKKSVVRAIPKYLKLLDSDIDYLEQIDDRLITYITNVLDEEDKHNKYEILAVFRFLDFIEKYSFDVSKFKKFVKFYEYLRFPSEQGQKSFKLTPVQVFQFASIYGFIKDDGYRLCNDALLYVPRKFSKTTSVAACAIFDLLFGPSDAQAYIASNSFNQAKICFDIISNTLKPLDPGMQSFRRNRDKIYSKLPGKTSFIQCLSSAPDRLDGLNSSLIILDEYAAATSAALKNVLTSSQGIRKEPLIITITTASSNLDGPFQTDLANYKKILDGTISDDSVFASIFEPDLTDDFASVDTWFKVQPHMGVTVTEEFYHRSWKRALRSAEDLLEFKTKLLNVFAPATKADWISPKVIKRNTVSIKLSDITTRPMCMVAVDLSVKDDLSCVCYGLYDSISKSFSFYCDYYIPKETLYTHSNSEMYLRWAEQGYIHICGEEVIDYQQIGKDILENSKFLNILSINYDSYKNRDLTNYLKAQGVKCLSPYRQVYSEFTSPIESFQQGIHEDKIHIDENPINAWCLQNCVIDEDNMGNRKMIKQTANRKIDGAVCIAMSLGAFMKWKR